MEGDGHDENFEVFFEKADEPAEKRRRTSEPAADEEQARMPCACGDVLCACRRCAAPRSPAA